MKKEIWYNCKKNNEGMEIFYIKSDDKGLL